MIHPSEAVTTRDDLANFVALLARDARQARAWNNKDVYSFLEALAAWIKDMDGYFLNRGEQPPQEASWRTFAQMLAAAAIYE